MKSDMFIDFLTFSPNIYVHSHLFSDFFSFPDYKCQGLTKKIFFIFFEFFALLTQLYLFLCILYQRLVHFSIS